MPTAFAVPAEAPEHWGVPYKHFIVPTDFEEDRWVGRAEAKARGNRAVVHHIVMFVVPPGEALQSRQSAHARLAGTAPGDMPLNPPARHGQEDSRRLTSSSSRCTTPPTAQAQTDRSSVGPDLRQGAAPAPGADHPRHNLGPSAIPPGADNHQVEAGLRFRREGHILGFMPHMHLRGKDFVYRAIYPDGKTEVLLSVPRFNFNWQSVYRLAEPMAMPKGTKLHCVAHFDNSAKNPNNPDPTKTVYWGDQTWEEMMIGWTDFVYDKPAS